MLSDALEICQACFSIMDISEAEESAQFLIGYLIINIVLGYSLTLIFFVAHNVKNVEYPVPGKASDYTWAEHQLRTTANFKANRIFSFLLGGLSYQIEHHPHKLHLYSVLHV